MITVCARLCEDSAKQYWQSKASSSRLDTLAAWLASSIKHLRFFSARMKVFTKMVSQKYFSNLASRMLTSEQTLILSVMSACSWAFLHKERMRFLHWMFCWNLWVIVSKKIETWRRTYMPRSEKEPRKWNNFMENKLRWTVSFPKPTTAPLRKSKSVWDHNMS